MLHQLRGARGRGQSEQRLPGAGVKGGGEAGAETKPAAGVDSPALQAAGVWLKGWPCPFSVSHITAKNNTEEREARDSGATALVFPATAPAERLGPPARSHSVLSPTRVVNQTVILQ